MGPEIHSNLIFSRFPQIREIVGTPSNSKSILHYSFEGSYEDPDCNVIAPYVDSEWYLRTYPDVLIQSMDPVVHYHNFGWREGRVPNQWFDTAFYLRSHPDVQNGNVNPFWHYLVAGQQEGRPTCPDNEGEAALQLDVIAACQNPNDQPGYPVVPEGAKLHAFDELVDAIQERLIGARGLVISVSHDRYIDNIGGTQLCIADEQDRFMSDCFCYLHISPSIARLTLAREEDFSGLQVCINGIFIGLAEPADLARAIQHCRDTQALARAMIVHCVLGHAPSALIGIWKALRPHHSFWWLHDFSTVCEGFHLLRNKVKYCKGTGVNSLSCRVCAYGSTRERHVARIHALFEQIPFRMLAPSASALEIWRGSCDLPYLDAGVHAHSALENPTPIPNNTPLDAPIRVAFIGYTGVHKGYQHFDRLTKMLRDTRYVEFYNFASEHKHPELPRVIYKEVKVTRKDPHAMVSALQQANIDLVLMLSP